MFHADRRADRYDETNSLLFSILQKHLEIRSKMKKGRKN